MTRQLARNYAVRCLGIRRPNIVSTNSQTATLYNPGVVYNETSGLWQCCGTENGAQDGALTCGSPTNQSFQALTPQQLIAAADGISSSSPTTTSATATASSPSSSANSAAKSTTSAASGTQTSSASSSKRGSLSTGAEAGIGAGVGVLALAILALLALILIRRRRRNKLEITTHSMAQNQDTAQRGYTAYTAYTAPAAPVYREKPVDPARHEMDASVYHELNGPGDPPVELEGSAPRK